MILLLETLFFAESTVKLPIFLAVCVVNLLVNTTSDSIFSPARCILPFSESPLLTSVITAKSLCSPFEAFNDFGNILKFASQFAISRISSSERKGFLFVFSWIDFSEWIWSVSAECVAHFLETFSPSAFFIWYFFCALVWLLCRSFPVVGSIITVWSPKVFSLYAFFARSES